MEERFSSSDVDTSFTSSSATTFAANSARSSLTISNSFSSAAAGGGADVKPHPHHRSDPHWSAIRAVRSLSTDGALHLGDLQLIRHVGSGNLARVFHCRLRGFSGEVDFALKVVDVDSAASRAAHVRSEGLVLKELDHPFLPTLYARFDASHYACFLVDYCAGGDLHALLRRMPRQSLPVGNARFYVAEVVVALEYLHALGFVYRDLKPENVLLREDGHVMLSDFDLCFRSDVVPTLLRRQILRKPTGHRRFIGTCFSSRAKKEGREQEERVEFVAEPKEAFSRACVGTHEYLAPEMVAGDGHGSGVDWWALGVFLYELLYGRTPFRGSTKEATLQNIAAANLRLPPLSSDGGADDAVLSAARDLISRLLVRDPQRRLGSWRGAAEIKRHAFFDGVNWPLLHNYKPPELLPAPAKKKKMQGRGRRRWVSGSIIGKLRAMQKVICAKIIE